MSKLKIPDECREWLDEATLAALLKIGEAGVDGAKVDHATKKMLTTMLVAYALENDVSLDRVFERDDTCARSVWYDKWRWVPSIVAAQEACQKRIRVWRLSETARREAFYTDKRLSAIAEFAADAPVVLADIMADRSQRAVDRRAAANDLLGWADPDRAEKVRPGAVSGDGNSASAAMVQVLIPDNGRGDRVE